MTRETALIRAGMVAAYGLRADLDASVVIVPPETHNYIVTQQPGVAMDYVELHKWTNGTDTFHIGYSEKQKTIVLAFPEAL